MEIIISLIRLLKQYIIANGKTDLPIQNQLLSTADRYLEIAPDKSFAKEINHKMHLITYSDNKLEMARELIIKLESKISISEQLDAIINHHVFSFTQNYTSDRCFEELLSFGELVDRLTIVNGKLYSLKNEVVERQNEKEFCAWQAVQDIRLVKERARLKKCIDEKLTAMIRRIAEGDQSGGFNAEVKKYGSDK